MADGIFMDRISGSLANWMRRAGFAAQIESQLSDCNRSAQGAKCIRRLTRYTAHAKARRVYDTISSRLHEQKNPTCELRYFDRRGVALFRVRRIDGRNLHTYRRGACAPPPPFPRGRGAVGLGDWNGY